MENGGGGPYLTQLIKSKAEEIRPCGFPRRSLAIASHNKQSSSKCQRLVQATIECQSAAFAACITARARSHSPHCSQGKWACTAASMPLGRPDTAAKSASASASSKEGVGLGTEPKSGVVRRAGGHGVSILCAGEKGVSKTCIQQPMCRRGVQDNIFDKSRA